MQLESPLKRVETPGRNTTDGLFHPAKRPTTKSSPVTLDLSALRTRLSTPPPSVKAPATTITDVAKIAIVSPNLYPAIAMNLFIWGNVGQSWQSKCFAALSMLAYAALGVHSLRNEIREKLNTPPTQQHVSPQTNASGKTSFSKDFLKSPGMGRSCSSIIQGTLALTSAWQGAFGLSAAYLLGFFGAAAAAYQADKDTKYWELKKIPTIIATSFNVLRKLPPSVKKILKDPGLFWVAGDNVAAFLYVSLPKLFASTTLVTTAAVGLLCSAVGSAPSVASLFGRKVSLAKPEFATLCSGVQCVAFSVINAAQSKYWIAGSFLMFGLTSFCMARVIRNNSKTSP